MNDNTTTRQDPERLNFVLKFSIILVMIFISSNAFATASMTIRTRSIVIVHAAKGILKINTKPIILQAKNTNTQNRTATPTPSPVTSNHVPKLITTRSIVIVHATNGILKINTKPIILQAKNANTQNRTPTPTLPSVASNHVPKSITTRSMIIVRAKNGILEINTKPIIIKAQ